MRVLILSGASAGIFAYGGAQEALTEVGWEPDCIAGSSAGALAAAMIGAGRGARIRGVARTVQASDLFGMPGPFPWSRAVLRLRRTRGVFDPSGLRRILGRELPPAVAAQIPLGRVCVYAVDIERGRSVVVRSGEGSIPLVDGIMGSAALPLVFPPHAVRPRGRREVVYLRDGGIMHNHPVATAKRLWHEHRREGRAAKDFECFVLSALDPVPTGAIARGFRGIVDEALRVSSLMLSREAAAAHSDLEEAGIPFQWVPIKTDIPLTSFTSADALRVCDQGYDAVRRFFRR